MKYFRWLLACVLCPLAPAAELYVRVVDVGAGECAVIKIPGEHYIVYDAGHWKDNGKTALDAIHSIIPANAEIGLMVISHTDGDHMGAVAKIISEYRVKKVIHSGVVRDTDVWRSANAAINAERENEGCIDVNLKNSEFPFGGSYRFGKAVVVMVAGFNFPPKSWGKLDAAETMNAGSIVIRVLYAGKSILFCGDAVGRHSNDPEGTCIAAERFMVDGAGVIPIKSNVLLAPHHGADNGSSLPFIRAVKPEYVIFSAGHEYEHPRQTTAARYIKARVSQTKMFRTDRGDDEGPEEWSRGRIAGTKDKPGDDDVEVTISDAGQIKVKYRN